MSARELSEREIRHFRSVGAVWAQDEWSIRRPLLCRPARRRHGKALVVLPIMDTPPMPIYCPPRAAVGGRW